MTYVAELYSLRSLIQLNSLFSGKIRVKLLTRLLLNPASKVYLRGLEKDFGVSSNTVRLELNKLSEMKLIIEDKNESKTKHYSANVEHPLFQSLRSIILKYVGLDHLLEEVIYKLGDVDKVYLTGALAEGKDSPFIDIVIIGKVDKLFMATLIEKAERLSGKKIRIALYSVEEFSKADVLSGITCVCVFSKDENINPPVV